MCVCLQLSSTAGLGQVHLHAGSTQDADIGGVTPRIAVLTDFTNKAPTTYTASNPLSDFFTLGSDVAGYAHFLDLRISCLFAA